MLSISTLASQCGQPVRIVTLEPSIAELVASVGAEHSIVGVVQHTDYPKALTRVPRVGSLKELNIDHIKALKPKCIIGVQGNANLAKVKRAALPGVNVIGVDTSSLDVLPQAIIKVGNAVGKSELAQKVATESSKEIDKLSRTYQNKKPVSAYLEIHHSPSGEIWAAGKGSFLNDIVSACGGQNIYAHSSSPYFKPRTTDILNADPQAVLLFEGNAPNKNWKQNTQMQAVKNSHVFYLPDDQCLRFASRLVTCMQAICTRLNQVREDQFAAHNKT